MERIARKFKNFQDEEKWDIEQHVRMSLEERQKAAKNLRDRFYGKKPPDVREARESGWKPPIFPKTSKNS